MNREDYEALFEDYEALRAELHQRDETIKRLRGALEQTAQRDCERFPGEWSCSKFLARENWCCPCTARSALSDADLGKEDA